MRVIHKELFYEITFAYEVRSNVLEIIYPVHAKFIHDINDFLADSPDESFKFLISHNDNYFIKYDDGTNYYTKYDLSNRNKWDKEDSFYKMLELVRMKVSS